MNFKLDENLGRTIQEVFLRRGYDCQTVREQRLGGASDPNVLNAAVSEGRILVTMDHDFGNILAYPPARTSGVAIISVPGRVTKPLLVSLVEALLTALQQKALEGKLWIVEPGRIREHEVEGIGGTEERRQ